MAYRLWRNKVQRGIKAAKYHYYHNKAAKLEQINPAKWWRDKEAHRTRHSTGIASPVPSQRH